jgi:hypothetical protein
MNQHDERQEILNSLKAYAEKHSAEFFCVILTPQPSGRKISMAYSGETEMIIEGLVTKEVLAAPTKR